MTVLSLSESYRFHFQTKRGVPLSLQSIQGVFVYYRYCSTDSKKRYFSIYSAGVVSACFLWRVRWFVSLLLLSLCSPRLCLRPRVLSLCSFLFWLRLLWLLAFLALLAAWCTVIFVIRWILDSIFTGYSLSHFFTKFILPVSGTSALPVCGQSSIHRRS
jgi:hypothetical protein